jgi:hypothetical protein
MGSSVTLDDVNVTAPAPSATPAPARQAPYAVRQIDLTFKLGAGPYGQVPGPPFTIRGLKVILHADLVVSPTGALVLVMKVYGMTLDQMNSLSVAGLQWQARDNQVLVQAGDAISGMTSVFNGQFQEAYPVLDTAEDAHFFIHGIPTYQAALKPVPPSSYPGAVSAADAIASMCKVAGFNFTNNGVTAVLNSPYFPGTAWQQIQSAVEAANCFSFYDCVSNTLTVWPKNFATLPDPQVVISPATGMIGYPRFSRAQIIVRTLFNPSSALTPGKDVLVKSQLSAANNAKIRINRVTHDLSAQTPDGPWETTIVGQAPQA